MNYGKRFCLYCGKEFEAEYISQLTCGDVCRKERKKASQNAYNRKRWDTIRNNMSRITELEARIAELEKVEADLKDQLKKITMQSPAEKIMVGEKAAQIRKLKSRISELEEENDSLRVRLVACGIEI